MIPEHFSLHFFDFSMIIYRFYMFTYLDSELETKVYRGVPRFNYLRARDVALDHGCGGQTNTRRGGSPAVGV